MFHSSCVAIMMSVALLTESSVESSISVMRMDEHV